MLRIQEAGVQVIWAGEPLTDQTLEVDYVAGDVVICQDDEVQ